MGGGVGRVHADGGGSVQSVVRLADVTSLFCGQGC
jgi:hypothetical protein